MSRGKGKKADLYDHLQEKRPGVSARAKEWGLVAKRSYVKAIRDLLTLLIRSCGLDAVEVSLPASELDNKEQVDEYLGEIQEFISENGLSYEGAGGYPVIVKKFRKDYLSFWSAIVNQIKESILFQDYVCNSLKYWLIGLSGSSIRSFRHTATITGMELILSLAKVRSEIGKKQEKLEHQRLAARSEKEKATRALRNLKKGTTEQKKQRAQLALDEAKKTLNDLQAKINEFSGKMKGLKSIYEDLLKGIFLVRYRDTVPEIRRDLVQSLGTLIREVYQIFLTNDYLKYLGIALHDKDKDVRLIAVTELHKLYSDSNHIQKLDKFTKFYKKRYLEMLDDVSPVITCRVIELMIELANAGFLEDDEIQNIVLRVNSSEKSIRGAAGNFLKQCVFSQIGEEEAKTTKKTKKKGQKSEPTESKSTINLRKLVDLVIELNLSLPFVVETLMPKMDFLKDWSGFITLLHDNDEDGLSEDDKICVARLFVLAVKISCGEKNLFSQARDPSKVVEISGDLYKLLDMYQAEPKVLTELCALPRYVPGDSLAKSIKEIVKLLVKVTEKATDDELLANAVQSLEYLSSELNFKIAKDAFDQLQETLTTNLHQSVIQESNQKELTTLLKKLKIVFQLSGSMPDVEVWDDLSQIWSSISSGEFPQEMGSCVIKLLALSLLHLYRSIPEQEYGKKGALLVQRRDFLVREIFEKNFLEPKELDQREAFHHLINFLCIFGDRVSPRFRLELSSQLIQDMCAYVHTAMVTEEADTRENSYLLSEICIPFQSWSPSTPFAEKLPRFDTFEKFSITEVGSEMLLHYKEDSDVVKKRVVQLARSFGEDVLADVILRTVIKHFIHYTDQVEEEEEEKQPQLYRQFTSDCSRLGSFYFGFKGGKEKEKGKEKGKEKEKEKEKDKGEEKETGNEEENWDVDQPEPEVSILEEVDLSLELQHKRRKALIQLIRNGTSFLLEDYRERCDLIAGLVPFVGRLPTTDLETNSSTDALSCVQHMEREMKRVDFDETEEGYQTAIENINRFLALLKKKAGLIKELPNEKLKGKEAKKAPQTPKKTPKSSRKRKETPTRSTPSRSAKKRKVENMYAESSDDEGELELVTSPLLSTPEREESDAEEESPPPKAKTPQKKTTPKSKKAPPKAKGTPTKKRKASQRQASEEEEEEEEEEEQPKPSKPSKRRKVDKPAPAKRRTRSSSSVSSEEEESEDEEEDTRPGKKRMSASAALKLMVEHNQASPASGRQLRKRK